MRVLLCKVGQSTIEANINPNLKSMQKIVGGYIEQITNIYQMDGFAVICNDGTTPNLPMNRNHLRGDFFITKVKGDEYVSLTDDDIIKLKEIFK